MKKNAFSLIEVTLSLGIVAFVLLTIMALMPTGLNMMHDSIQSEVQANIITELRGQFQQLPFVKHPLVNGVSSVGDASWVGDIPNQIDYYDTQGNALTAGDPSAYYQATFKLNSLSGRDPTINYVGNDSTGIATNNAVLVNVILQYPYNMPGIPQHYITNSIFVAKQVGR